MTDSLSLKIVIATGGFDPLHSGHIEYLQAAKSRGNFLVVGLNSDDWLIRKKGKYFLPFLERFVIMSNLRMVDRVIGFDDKDDTAINAIKETRKMFPHDDLIFVNGGDRTAENIPEMACADKYGVQFFFGIGGTKKINSSSWILKEWEEK